MIALDDQKETIHIYVVRQEQDDNSPRPSIVPLVLSIIALSILIAIGVTAPYRQPEQETIVRVPAVPLPVRSFTAKVAIIPTGIKSFPATRAVGTLTITNGSILTEILPAGTIFTGADIVEVITDQQVTIPPGSATGLGIAYVSAHTVIPGARGNIPTLDINITEGTALFIRNTTAFHGGADAYSIRFITQSDRDSAIAQARQALTQKTSTLLLSSPCHEEINASQTIQVTWQCQPMTYRMPNIAASRIISVHVVRVSGSSLILNVVFVARPHLYLFPGK